MELPELLPSNGFGGSPGYRTFGAAQNEAATPRGHIRPARCARPRKSRLGELRLAMIVIRKTVARMYPGGLATG